MQNFKGIFPALLTPFDARNQVNTETLAQLVAYNLNKGVTGFYVGGSTAEAFLLDESERKLIMKTVSDCAHGKCTLIAHVGSISTAQAVRLACYAKELGYDAVSSVAPFYYKFSFAEIKQYYLDVAHAAQLPMLIYNFPAFSGVTLTVDNIRTLFSQEGVIGIKHTSSDYFMLQQIKFAFPDKLVYNGYDETFLAGLAMGADGAIGSTFNFMAEKFIQLREAFLRQDMNTAAKLQQDANAIIAALCKVGVMQGEKAILDELGFSFGPARAPFAPLTAEQRSELLHTVMPLL